MSLDATIMRLWEERKQLLDSGDWDSADSKTVELTDLKNSLGIDHFDQVAALLLALFARCWIRSRLASQASLFSLQWRHTK